MPANALRSSRLSARRFNPLYHPYV